MRNILIYILIKIFSTLRKCIELNDYLLKMALISHTEKIQYKIGKLKAYSVFLKTKRQVPAYKKFLQSVGYKKMKFNGIIPNLTCIPIIDKESYIILMGSPHLSRKGIFLFIFDVFNCFLF